MLRLLGLAALALPLVATGHRPFIDFQL